MILLTMIFKVIYVHNRNCVVSSGYGHFPNFCPLVLFLWVWKFKNVCMLFPFSFFSLMATYKYSDGLDCFKIKIVSSPKRRTLLFRVTTRTPDIGLGRAPPGTSLHSPAEGRYTSVEARRSQLESWPPVTSNTLNHFLSVLAIFNLSFTLSLSWDKKLVQPWLLRPVLSPELKSSIHPFLPYLDTVVGVSSPPVTSTVSVSGSGIEHACL